MYALVMLGDFPKTGSRVQFLSTLYLQSWQIDLDDSVLRQATVSSQHLSPLRVLEQAAVFCDFLRLDVDKYLNENFFVKKRHQELKKKTSSKFWQDSVR